MARFDRIITTTYNVAMADVFDVLENLTKAKFTKRTGSPGNYKYTYAVPVNFRSGAAAEASKKAKAARLEAAAKNLTAQARGATHTARTAEKDQTIGNSEREALWRTAEDAHRSASAALLSFLEVVPTGTFAGKIRFGHAAQAAVAEARAEFYDSQTKAEVGGRKESAADMPELADEGGTYKRGARVAYNGRQGTVNSTRGDMTMVTFDGSGTTAEGIITERLKPLEKSMDVFDDLETMGKAHGTTLPTHRPVMGGSHSNTPGVSAEGAQLNGYGKTGSETTVGHPDATKGADKAKRDKLSEDDDENEETLAKLAGNPTFKTTKADEMTRKSLDAWQQANHGADIGAPGSSQSTRAFMGPTPMAKSVEDVNPTGHIDHRQYVHGAGTADEQATALLKKSQTEFYGGGDPSAMYQPKGVEQHKQCPGCQVTMAKALSVCTKCGHGSVGAGLHKSQGGPGWSVSDNHNPLQLPSGPVDVLFVE